MPTPNNDPNLETLLIEVRALQRDLTKTPPRLLRRASACEYLGVGRSWFEEHIRPEIPEIKRGGVVLFDRNHLDKWADTHLADSINDKQLLRSKHK